MPKYCNLDEMYTLDRPPHVCDFRIGDLTRLSLYKPDELQSYPVIFNIFEQKFSNLISIEKTSFREHQFIGI